MPTATKKALAKAAPTVVSDVVELDELASTVEALRKVKARIGKLEREEAKYTKAIKDALGDASAGLVGGEKVVSWATVERRNVSVALLKEKYADVAEKCVVTTKVRTFSLLATE